MPSFKSISHMPEKNSSNIWCIWCLFLVYLNLLFLIWRIWCIWSNSGVSAVLLAFSLA